MHTFSLIYGGVVFLLLALIPFIYPKAFGLVSKCVLSMLLFFLYMAGVASIVIFTILSVGDFVVFAYHLFI